MASSYSDLGIELMATGENSGTWGTKTNTNLQIIEKSIAGYVEKSIAGGAATTALSITDGDTTESTSVARHAVIKLTGTITGNQIVTVPDSIEKVYIIVNGTSGAYSVQFKTASGTGVTFGASDKGTKLVFSDGTNIVDTSTGNVGTYDLNGESLILDADADTTITADTDDQIDIAIAGADDFRFTANTFTALSGSSVVIPDGGLTLGSTAVTSTAAELNLLDGVSGLVQADLTKLAAVDSTAAELNIVDGGTSATSTTVADADRVVLNDNGTMVQVAVTDLAAYFDDEITAMPNLTSVGTLTTLTVDNIIINGTNIGHTSDTDALAIDSSGNVTASQNLVVTGDLTVSGDDITMGTNTAGNLLIADGTNFNSVAVGSLSEISTVANDDVFLAVDTSGGGLKKIARSAVVSGLASSSAISNVVEDTTPQLGGNLDMNGQDIVTTSNADLELAPNGTGHVTVKGNDNPGTIQFNCENNSHGQQIKAAAHSIGSSAVVTIPDITGDMIVGKIEGTNFTDSLLIGHSTTGTLSSAEDNTGVGIGALDALTSGDRNTALGNDAGTAVTTANNNTLLGFEAGKGITGANMNVAIGDSAFAGSNTDNNSASNTVVGAFAMNVSSGAKENTAIGRDAGREVTTGDNNIFLGYNAGANDSTSGITTGSGNVIIGTIDPDSRTGDRQLKIAGYDGSTTTTWISGNNDGDLTFAHDVILANDSFIQFGDAGENIAGDGTDLAITSSAKIDLKLGSGNPTVAIYSDGTQFGHIKRNSGNFDIRASESDADITLRGNDGGSAITALTLDMSEAGAATFNSTVTANAGVVVDNITIDGTEIDLSSGDLTLDVAGDIKLNAAGNNILFESGSTEYLQINNSSGSAHLKNSGQDADILFIGNDGGSTITALTLDMSDAGTAVFNHDIRIADGGQIGSASDSDAIAIASNGVVTFSQTPVNSAGAAFITDDPTALAIALG